MHISLSRPARWFAFSSPLFQGRLPYIGLLGAVFVSYANIYGNLFFFDDGVLIQQNTLLRHWQSFPHLFTTFTSEGAGNPGGFYRPMQTIFYFFIYQFSGSLPTGFHFLNVGLHAANACLLYRVGRGLNFHKAATFFGALIWAVHPLHTEAITYMSGTADPLYAFFCLVCLVALLPDFTPRRIVGICPLFILALLSKETAIVFPFLAALCFFLVSQKRYVLKNYFRFWPLALLLVTYLVIRLTLLWHDNGPIFDRPDYSYIKLYNEHFFYRLMTFLAVVPVYLSLIAWPHDLYMEREFPVYMDVMHPAIILGVIVIIIWCICVFRQQTRQNLPFIFGLLWFAITLFPTSGLLLPVNALLCEHWLYLPTAGLIMGFAQSVQTFVEDRHLPLPAKGLAILGCVIALAFGGRTYNQNFVWHDPIRFYMHILAHGPGSERTHNNLGLAYIQKGNYEKAIEQFRQAIRTADTLAEPHLNLALALFHLPDRHMYSAEAIDELHRALAINPDFYRVYIALALVYQSQGDDKNAALNWQKSEEIRKKIAPFLDYKDILSP